MSLHCSRDDQEQLPLLLMKSSTQTLYILVSVGDTDVGEVRVALERTIEDNIGV